MTRLQADGIDPNEMTYQYMPNAVSDITVEMKTCTFAELPEDLENFSCYSSERDLLYCYGRLDNPQITKGTTTGRIK